MIKFRHSSFPAFILNRIVIQTFRIRCLLLSHHAVNDRFGSILVNVDIMPYLMPSVKPYTGGHSPKNRGRFLGNDSFS